MGENGYASVLADLLPTIRKRREEIERERCLPGDLAGSLRKAGLYGMSVPRVLGGSEATPMELMETIETVSAADGSTGWCVMVGLGNNVVAGYMPEHGAREVFADPTLPTAGIAAPAGQATRVDGGVNVTGRWSFASGIAHCDWVWAGALVMDNGKPHMTEMGPEIVHVCIPARDVVVHDTWHVSGLRGTGSQDFSIEDAFVPDQRIFGLLNPVGHRSEPLYQFPPLHLFVFQVVSVGLGIARGALDDLTELSQKKAPTMYTGALADRPIAQIEVARAEVALRSARAFVYEVVEEMWDMVLSGGMPSRKQLALGRVAATNAVEVSAVVTRTVNTLGGGSAIYDTSPLQRHARDAEAITHHFTVAPFTWEEAGRVLLGRDPVIPVF
ncbi:MAG TPA: acyl-CoA dehydrogenase family protein [Rhodothermales bacterium]